MREIPKGFTVDISGMRKSLDMLINARTEWLLADVPHEVKMERAKSISHFITQLLEYYKYYERYTPEYKTRKRVLYTIILGRYLLTWAIWWGCYMLPYHPNKTVWWILFALGYFNILMNKRYTDKFEKVFKNIYK